MATSIVLVGRQDVWQACNRDELRIVLVRWPAAYRELGTPIATLLGSGSPAGGSDATCRGQFQIPGLTTRDRS